MNALFTTTLAICAAYRAADAAERAWRCRMYWRLCMEFAMIEAEEDRAWRLATLEQPPRAKAA